MPLLDIVETKQNKAVPTIKELIKCFIGLINNYRDN